MGFDAITAGEGQALTLAYGEHVALGHLIVNRDVGDRALLLALGRGPWDSCVNLWYKGGALERNFFHFHPGTQSSGLSDPVQGVDGFYPAGITFSGTAYIAIRIPDTFTEVDPSGIVGRYKTLIISDYDDTGRAISFGYSANPARVFADLWIKQARRDPNRIDWASWYQWRQACDQLIAWDDGVTASRTIPRFEAHVAFTGAVELVNAINLITELSATTWQDTGAKLVFFPPGANPEPFTFDETVIVEKSLRTYETDRRSLPTFVRLNFRNLDSEFLAPAQWEERNDGGVEQRGTNGLGDLNFGPMTYSQAMRLSSFYLNRAASTWRRSDLDAFARSLAVLPGDFVQIEHALTGNVPGEVLETEDLGSEDGRRKFSIALRRANLYSDLDHEPIPTTLQVQTVS